MFVCSAMPHVTTGYQPYQLMFAHKAQTPCDHWLGLSQYDCDESVSKSSLVQEQYKLVWAANKWTLKGICQSIQCSAQRKQSKALEIPKGNLGIV